MTSEQSLEEPLQYVIGEIEYVGRLLRKRQKRAQNEKSVGLREWADGAPAQIGKDAEAVETLARRLRRELLTKG